MTITKTQAKATLKADQPNPFAVPDASAVVVIQPNTREGSFAVWVEVGTRVDGWSATFADEATALAEARRAYRAFATFRTGPGIEARRDELAVELNKQSTRSRRRMHSVDEVGAIEAELTALETFGDRALLNQLTADLTDRYAA